MNFFRSASHLLAAVFNDRSEFEQSWNGYQDSAAGPGAFQGRWRGEWVSTENGHHGELRCLLSDAGPGRFRANFRATYARWLSVAYAVVLNAERDAGGCHLKGEADLGMLAGGIYSYDGELTPATFECGYRCKYDHGTFHLKRLQPAP